ncbi:myosin-11 isoform X3 [Diorhabda sublineata]|uniref:myosin-11 isoform X3 n=1 Tax=Diorhabda sublineata TaxID=1163346 RepID=UPI0024E15677|nr:myosin-11 isoform X3 [Diorhabda sublineata]
MIDRSRRLSYENAGYISGKMVNDLSPRKTMLVLVIVVGCFAVLWPKVFYPMLVGSANTRIKPSSIDRTQGCCDVIYERDVTTIKLMSEICKTIIKNNEENSLLNKDVIQKCQSIVLDTCGIDISAVLQGQVRLGHSTKQILEEIRSLNGSLCLKYNFGVAPWELGVPHRVNVKMLPSSTIRQERPLHLRSEMVHPAFRERGRAIPQTEFTPTKPAPPSHLIKKVVEGKPGPIPGMRPTIGGAGHIVPPSKQGGNTMGLIMPLYTIGIVVFFAYTVMKVVFKKQSDALYPPINPDPHFRREVFQADRRHLESKVSKDSVSSKLGDTELDRLRYRLRETEMAMERIVEQMAKVPLKFQDEVIANGSLGNKEDDQSSVQVLGLETSASRENGHKWTSSNSPIFPGIPSHTKDTTSQEIFLEGSLPPQSHLIVTDSATEAQKLDAEEDPAVVLAGKMTLSVISLDSSESATEESSIPDKKPEKRISNNVSEEFEKIDAAQLEEEINDIIADTEHVNTTGSQIKEIDDIRESVVNESEACIIQTPKNLNGVEKTILIKNEINDILESNPTHTDTTTSIEHVIEESVRTVVAKTPDNQQDLDDLLPKTEKDVAKTTEIIDYKIDEFQKGLFYDIQNIQDSARNEVTDEVKKLVNDIEAEIQPVAKELVIEKKISNKIELSPEIREVESLRLEQIATEIKGQNLNINPTGQFNQNEKIEATRELISKQNETIKETIVERELILDDEKKQNEKFFTTEVTTITDEISEQSNIQENNEVEDKNVSKANIITNYHATNNKAVELVSAKASEDLLQANHSSIEKKVEEHDTSEHIVGTNLVSEISGGPTKFGQCLLETDDKNEQEDEKLSSQDINISHLAETMLSDDINSSNNYENIVEEEYEDNEGEYEEDNEGEYEEDNEGEYEEDNEGEYEEDNEEEYEEVKKGEYEEDKKGEYEENNEKEFEEEVDIDDHNGEEIEEEIIEYISDEEVDVEEEEGLDKIEQSKFKPHV